MRPHPSGEDLGPVVVRVVAVVGAVAVVRAVGAVTGVLVPVGVIAAAVGAVRVRFRPAGAVSLPVRAVPGVRGRSALVVRERYRCVSAQGLLGGPGGEPAEDDPAVVADEDGARGDVAVRPAVGVQRAQRREHVGGDLGGAVRAEGLVADEGGERPGGDQLADDPQRAVLGEDVEDLVEARVVGYPGHRLHGLDGPPDGRVGGRAGVRVPVGAAGVLPADDLGLHGLRQEDLTDHDLLAAVRVEGTRLDRAVRPAVTVAVTVAVLAEGGER